MDLDDETKSDLMESFQELHEEAEACLSELLDSPDDETIHRLFRAIHNVKGNAGLLQLQSIVDFSHEVEEVAGALRTGTFTITKTISEVLLIALDRIGDLHKKELFGKPFDNLRINELKPLYHKLSKANNENADVAAQQITRLLGGGVDSVEPHLFSSVAKSSIDVMGLPEPKLSADEKLYADLSFFQELATQQELQMESLAGRSFQLFDWAMKMNAISGRMIDENQLAAAIYLHDFGMSFLPKELWITKLNMSATNGDMLAQHPYLAYNFLLRVPGWEVAATIALQHHEHVDGSGYPNGLKGDDIHPGAKILAILDTFFLLCKGRVDQSLRQSTVRAISTINARVDTEFEGLWVQCFNHVLRGELKAGYI